MTRDDLRILCTALGFAITVIKDVPENNQALRAKTVGKLIEAFCFVASPDALGISNENASDDDPVSIDHAIELHKAELLQEGSTHLPDDRASLLKFYDRLQQRRQRRMERHFYSTSSDALIANRVMQLIEEEINDEKSE